MVSYKLLSTPSDPSEAVIRGIEAVLALLSEAGHGATEDPMVILGSTVATNAVLEGKGATAGFVTTQGFEDTLEIARQNRSGLYDLEVRRRVSPVDREHCIGVAERIGPNGEIWQPLRHDAGNRLAERVEALGVASVAISLLHSYANPDHEKQLAAVLRRKLPGVHLTVSHELLPEHREYERAATCVINAVVAPPMIRYLRKVADRTGSGRLRVMASGGGSLPVQEVERVPVNTILSGPAGGVLGAWAVAGDAGFNRIITLDMGGTSTDVALCDGKPGRTTESTISDLPLRLPMIDIHTVGAGGGSVARVDKGGALRVGPESMGADPGPACYGNQKPPYIATVTDANVFMGYIPAAQKLSGSLPLDVSAAHAAVARVAEAANLSPEHAAGGILRVAEITMARAVQRISVERGHDPRDFVMIPFGGAGGLHACRLANTLGISRILFPQHAGILSALGMLTSSPLYAFSESLLLRISREQEDAAIAAIPDVRSAAERLRRRAKDALDAESVPSQDRILLFEIDVRYHGQSFELTLPFDDRDPVRLFEERHRALYGYDAPSKPVEIVALRLRATSTSPELRWPLGTPRTPGDAPPPFDAHEPTDPDGAANWSRIERNALTADDHFRGPVVITEYAATTIVAKGWKARVLPAGHLLAERRKSR